MRSIVQEQVWGGKDCMFKCLILKKIKANNDSLWKMLISTHLAPRNVVPVDKTLRGKFSKSFE